MSDTDTPQSAQDAPESTEPPAKESEGKGLRNQLEAALKENRELKAEKRDNLIAGLGLTTDTGMGKVLAEKFDKGEVGLDNLVSTAVEDYGVVIPEQIDQHPQAAEIRAGQAALEQVGQHAGSIAPPTREDVQAQAEAEGNFDQSLQMKGEQVAGWFQRGPNQ